jgi:TRAP-type C4-dicarboxylate transport system permease small subunit
MMKEVGFSIPALLNKTLALDVGPLFNLNLSLSDLGLTADVELALDSLNSLIKAMTVLFALGVGFTGLTFLASVTSMFIPHDDASGGLVLWSNLGAVSLALLFLILGGLLASIGARVAQDKINALGRTIGLNAAAGTKWIAIAWVGIGLMVAVAGYWIAAVVRVRRRRKGEVNYDDAEGRKGT